MGLGERFQPCESTGQPGDIRNCGNGRPRQCTRSAMVFCWLDRPNREPLALRWKRIWEYSAGEWAWVSGSDLPNQAGVYGTLGMASPSNIPRGGRYPGASWKDSSGDPWFFAGLEPEMSSGASPLLKDLWKYSAGEWTWMGGSNSPNQPGTYGNQGVASSSNIPGARSGSVSWTDPTGNFQANLGSRERRERRPRLMHPERGWPPQVAPALPEILGSLGETDMIHKGAITS